MDWIFDPSIWASLVTLSALEIVLGIDNIVFLSVITNALPPDRAHRARQIGLALALGFRIALLFAITWITQLTTPIFALAGQTVSWRDLILMGGGLFLIVKATQEIHTSIEGEEAEAHGGRAAAASFGAIIGQIVLIDAIFSLDSIITAIGMAEEVGVMIAAVCIAIAVMYVAADAVSGFIKRHPTTKMLALSFLMLIGVALVADGLHFHIPRGYIYFAMAFAAAVELFNVMARRNVERLPAAVRGAALRSPAYTSLPELSAAAHARDRDSRQQSPRTVAPAQRNAQSSSAARGRGGKKAKSSRGRAAGRKRR